MRRTVIATCVCAGLWIASIAGQPVQRSAGTPEYVPGEVLVKFRPAATAGRREALTASVNGRLVQKFDRLDTHHLRLSRGASVEAAVAALGADPDIQYVEPNYRVKSTQTDTLPNDPFW